MDLFPRADAIVNTDNEGSIKVLRRLGFSDWRQVPLTNERETYRGVACVLERESFACAAAPASID